jgi:hypothetical protein
MKDITRCIESLRVQLERHRKEGLKEYPTRTIFIDPMLSALGWDVRDPGGFRGLPLSNKFRIGCSPRVNVSDGGLMI